MSAQVKRLCTALCCLGVIVATPVVIEHVQQPTREASLSPSTSQVLSSYFEADANLALMLFEQLVGSHEESSLPQAFSEEVLDAEQVGRAHIYSAEGVVGLYWEKDPPSKDTIFETLTEQGWQRVGANESSLNFIKDYGQYRWLSLACHEMPNALSLVFDYRKEELDAETQSIS